MDHKVWMFFGLLVVGGCSSQNPLMAEVSDIKSQMVGLSKKIDESRAKKESDDKEHKGHGGEEGSPTEIEILKQTQALNRRLMSIEQKVSVGTKEVSEEVVKNQIIDVAKATLAQETSVGPGFITSAQLIEVLPGTDPGQWQVKIKFKKTRADKSVLLAEMICKNEQNTVTCEDLAIH